ncbi:hypothetical protein DFH06DRAFT_1122656 [Mycena polygramma]|nr:hypothetical protein DFH06DRAFT_1122656 [Mycena polygramma]
MSSAAVCLVLSLPIELQSMILAFTVRLNPSPKKISLSDRTTVCLVCHLWMDIMYGTSAHWAVIDVSFFHRHSALSVKRAVLNSQAAALTVSILGGYKVSEILPHTLIDGYRQDVEESNLRAFVHAMFSVFDPAFRRIVSLKITCVSKSVSDLIIRYLSVMDCRGLLDADLSLSCTPDRTLESARWPIFSTLPSLKSLSFRHGFPPIPFKDAELHLTVLRLVFIVRDLEPSWSDTHSLLASLPSLRLLDLSGLSCADFPYGNALSLTFPKLTHMFVAVGSKPMVGIISTIHAPSLHRLRVTVTTKPFVDYFIQACQRLLRATPVLELAALIVIAPSSLVDLLHSLSSTWRLDIISTPECHREAFAKHLLSSHYRLPSLAEVHVGWPVDDDFVGRLLTYGEVTRFRPTCMVFSPRDGDRPYGVVRGLGKAKSR